MRLALAQLNPRVGDLARNAAMVVDALRAARAQGADHALTPELVLTGAPPRDLLLDDGFVDDAAAALRTVVERSPHDLTAYVGTVVRAPARTPGHPGLYNALAVVRGGRVVGTVHKRLLPAYDVFHEPRWFVAGAGGTALHDGVGALVCEDLWDLGYPVQPGAELVAAGARVLACAAASPFRWDAYDLRVAHAARQGVPVAYANLVGGQDELVFDGGSFVTDATGRVTHRLPFFEEAVETFDLDAPADPAPAPPPREALGFGALVTGVRDFARKNGVRRAVLGLSGGVDSALVACVAREALGGANVLGVAMPTRFNDPRSTADALALGAALGIAVEVFPVEALAGEASRALGPWLDGLGAARAGDTTHENVQARVRAMVLLAAINRTGGMLLNTSNKTELALGYGTLHGDLAGTLAVIGDLTKPEVYALARWYDAGRGVIPPYVLARPPSAELREGQVDPFDYPVVAPRVEALVQGEAVEGWSGDDRTSTERSVRMAEHKRWQGGVVLKLSGRSFGSGRMMPVTRTR
ncbi:MAG: uncharacterized protein JWM10_3870 [Myxococcaceae bacterium]|nr:uncharacterized protein [Myxococcaceae bacterium]